MASANKRIGNMISVQSVPRLLTGKYDSVTSVPSITLTAPPQSGNGFAGCKTQRLHLTSGNLSGVFFGDGISMSVGLNLHKHFDRLSSRSNLLIKRIRLDTAGVPSQMSLILTTNTSYFFILVK